MAISMGIRVQIDNYCLTYRLDGDLSRPAILFLHGFMGDRFEFETAIATLSKQFYCVAIDLPAHGQTQVHDQILSQDHYYTIQSIADLVIKFLDFLHVKPCFLVGYSMGGRLALYLIIYYPQYFVKVMLESASAGLRTAKERGDRLAKDQQLATDLENLENANFNSNFKLFLDNWYRQLIFANLRSHPNFPQMLGQRLNNSPVKLAKSLRNLSIGLQPSLWEKLPRNKIPLLLVVGELDRKFVNINQQMEQLCKSSKLEIIPNCGHNVHFENPDLFIQKLEAFFTDD